MKLGFLPFQSARLVFPFLTFPLAENTSCQLSIVTLSLLNEDVQPTTQPSVKGPPGTRTGDTGQVGAGSPGLKALPKGTHITFSNSTDRLSVRVLPETDTLMIHLYQGTSVRCVYTRGLYICHIHVVGFAGTQTKQLPFVYWPLYWKLAQFTSCFLVVSLYLPLDFPHAQPCFLCLKALYLPLCFLKCVYFKTL